MPLFPKILFSVKSELIRGSVILLVFLNIFNLVNYVFQFIMARWLGPGEFAVLSTLFGLVYLFSIPSQALQLVSSRCVVTPLKEKRYDEVKGILMHWSKKALLYSLIIMLGIGAISPILERIFGISWWLFVVTSLILPFSIITPISKGILQSTKRFIEFGIATVVDGVVKLCIGALLVLIGFGVLGALVGVLASSVSAVIVSLYFLRYLWFVKGKYIRQQQQYALARQTLIVSVVIISLYSFDVPVAKALLSAPEAGIFAVAALLGKSIFFATFPISQSMFPYAMGQYKENLQTVLKQSLVLVIGLGILACSIFALFPELVIRLLFGSVFVDGASIVLLMGISYALLSISNVLLLYVIAQKGTSPFILLLLPVLQLVVLLFSSSKEELALLLLLSQIATLVSIIFWSVYELRHDTIMEEPISSSK